MSRSEFDLQISKATVIIISGSSSAAYDDEPWIHYLAETLVGAHSRQVKLVGICFGHQIIANALGGKAILNPKGSEIGMTTFSATDEALSYVYELFDGDDSSSSSSSSARGSSTDLSLYCWHSDIAVELPPDCQCGGSNENTKNQLFFNERCGLHSFFIFFFPAHFSDSCGRRRRLAITFCPNTSNFILSFSISSCNAHSNILCFQSHPEFNYEWALTLAKKYYPQEYQSIEEKMREKEDQILKDAAFINDAIYYFCLGDFKRPTTPATPPSAPTPPTSTVELSATTPPSTTPPSTTPSVTTPATLEETEEARTKRCTRCNIAKEENQFLPNHWIMLERGRCKQCVVKKDKSKMNQYHGKKVKVKIDNRFRKR
jgi:GMP synthase-like glutamine amidotransferase